jgi:hypothetical protein
LCIVYVHLLIVKNGDVSGRCKRGGAEERVGFDTWDNMDILCGLADIVCKLADDGSCSSCPIRQFEDFVGCAPRRNEEGSGGTDAGSGGAVGNNGWDGAAKDSLFDELLEGGHLVYVVDVLGWFVVFLLFDLVGWRGCIRYYRVLV